MNEILLYPFLLFLFCSFRILVCILIGTNLTIGKCQMKFEHGHMGIACSEYVRRGGFQPLSFHLVDLGGCVVIAAFELFPE